MADRLRIATWNLWWRFGDCEERAPLILNALRATAPDILGLQEVWFDDDENLAATIADALGFDHRFVASPAPGKWQRRIDDHRFGIGNAVLSRWPIGAIDTARLPIGDALDEGRVALQASIETPHGSASFTTTHLNSAAAHGAIRAEQLAEASRLVARHPDTAVPAILCGDFNAGPDEPEVTAIVGAETTIPGGIPLIDGWAVARPDDPGFTWDSANPHAAAQGEGSHRIDYLLFAPTANGATAGDWSTRRSTMQPVDGGLIGSRPIDGVWPSDHFGVWLDLAPVTG